MEMKYPNQVCAIKRKDKTLGVDAQLFLPGEKDNIYPLEMHSGYSRFVFTIIDKSSEGTIITPKANIPAVEIPYVFERTRLAMNVLFTNNISSEAAPSDVFGNSSAYTVKLSDKKFRGMSPAEVLLANSENCTELERIKKWLYNNLAKYPNNAKQIEAIENAITLNEIGELRKEDSPTSSDRDPIVLYSSEKKFMSSKNSKGYNRIYEISVVCDPEKKYPFILNIMNCYAPVEDFSGGQKRIKVSAAEDMIKSSLMLTDKEWYGLIDRTLTTLKLFENMHFKEMFKKAQENSFHH